MINELVFDVPLYTVADGHAEDSSGVSGVPLQRIRPALAELERHIGLGGRTDPELRGADLRARWRTGRGRPRAVLKCT